MDGSPVKSEARMSTAEVGQGEQVGAGAQVAGEEAGEGFWLEVDGCQR